MHTDVFFNDRVGPGQDVVFAKTMHFAPDQG